MTVGLTKTVLHYPRLDTVLMVEDSIKNTGEWPSKNSLWKSLPKQVQYQTFNIILEYLEKSNKIIFKENRIIWIASNPKLDSQCLAFTQQLQRHKVKHCDAIVKKLKGH